MPLTAIQFSDQYGTNHKVFGDDVHNSSRDLTFQAKFKGPYIYILLDGTQLSEIYCSNCDVVMRQLLLDSISHLTVLPNRSKYSAESLSLSDTVSLCTSLKYKPTILCTHEYLWSIRLWKWYVSKANINCYSIYLIYCICSICREFWKSLSETNNCLLIWTFVFFCRIV